MPSFWHGWSGGVPGSLAAGPRWVGSRFFAAVGGVAAIVPAQTANSVGVDRPGPVGGANFLARDTLTVPCQETCPGDELVLTRFWQRSVLRVPRFLSGFRRRVDALRRRQTSDQHQRPGPDMNPAALTRS